MNTNKKKIERSLKFSGLHVRESEDGERSRTVEGYAVVFNQRSVNLTPWSSYREVYEIMEKGSISQDLVNRSDVVLTAFHNNEIILGRSVNGRGTLQLQVDGKGLAVRCTLADTATGNELLASIERGDITGMSFAYTADEEDSENGVSYERIDTTADGKEVWLRHVKTVTGLYDVTIAGHPAYPQTEIAQREVDSFLDDRIGEPAKVIAKREAEAQAERERLEREERERKEREAVEAAELAADLKRRQRAMFALKRSNLDL